jgi:hypothetical protein
MNYQCTYAGTFPTKESLMHLKFLNSAMLLPTPQPKLHNHPQSSTISIISYRHQKPVLQAFQGLPLQLNMQHGARQDLHGKAQAMSTAKGLGHRENARSVGRSDFTHGVAKHQGRHLTPPQR